MENDNYQSILEEYVKKCKIFIDTCSLVNDNINKFWVDIIPLLLRYNNKIIIPSKVIMELQKHAIKGDISLSKRANQALSSIKRLMDSNLIDIRGEKTDNFADNVFLTVFTKYRLKYELLLITQDKNLMKDIDNLNKLKSNKGKRISIKKLVKNGKLVDFSDRKDKNIFNNINKKEVFKVCKEVTLIKDDVLNLTNIPKENEIVYSESRGEIKLLKKVAAGGEGIIYTTDDLGYVAKIYKKENNTRRKYEKLKRMISKDICCEGICYPKDILYNSYKEFVGYLMPEARGKELGKSIFIKPLFLKNFPNWKKKDTVELCVNILKKIKYLHERNIIMGDINPANILIISPKEIYFVDTDSYQIEDFPCPVGTNNYTAPEIQRKHFPDFLRTIGNENFAVATLLFMIMLPGKPPYSQQGGEDPISNIINMDFSYPLKDEGNGKTPDGPWRYIWSHLTYDLKKAFYNTFKKNCKNSEENTRLSCDEWLSIFEYYLELLNSGKFGEQDKMSEELFPKRYKKILNLSYKICKECGKEFPEDILKDGVCKECRRKIREYLKEVKDKKICIQCGKEFEITNGEYEYYTSKGLEIPKRCKECRKNKDKSSKNEASYYTGNSLFNFSSIIKKIFENK